MTSPPDDTTTDTSAIIAALRAERDAALSEKAALAEALATRTAELATRNTEYGERIEHQSATIDVLKAMSASPDDPQPVFDLIVDRARDLCDAYGATVFEFDGTGIHWRAATGVSDDPAVRAAYEAQFPMVPTRGWAFGRAILDRQIIRIDDMEAEPGLDPTLRGITAKSNVTTPIMRGDEVIGAIGMGSREKGGFSDSQVELLKTFAEQAAIAITSAETYRALQTRTSDLQETLEYQTATSDVLKVISRSTFDLQPVLTMVAETAVRLCFADQAAIFRLEGDIVHLAANYGFPPEYKAYWDELGPVALGKPMVTALSRTIHERHSVHVHDVTSVPGYPDEAIRLGKQRTSLGVPLLREGEPIGVILLARQRVEPFTDRQIELVSTFADQAVIAIENTRLITEQREALEQQTATAEVLQAINTSPGNLAPVFDAILEKAHRLCGAVFGALLTYDGEALHLMAERNLPPAWADFLRGQFRPGPGHPVSRLIQGEPLIHIDDMAELDGIRDDPMGRAAIELGGIRTLLLVPLRKNDGFLGYITAYRQEVRPFTDRQIALLQNFAAQAVIAVENARLITETREALEQQTATAEVLGVINASPGDLPPVFDAMLEKAMRLCDAAFGALATFDGSTLRTAATRGVPPEYARFRMNNPPVYGPKTAPGRLMAGEQHIHNIDLKAEDAYREGEPNRRALVDIGGARSALQVALRKDDALLGSITIYRQEVRPFTDKQIALLQNFAAQAVIAMENARLLTEQREALERQTATAEVLQVINASPGDLAPVFDAILEKAHSLCGAAAGTLTTYNGAQMRAVATRGGSPAWAEAVRRPRPPGSNDQQIISGNRYVEIPDLQALALAPVDDATFRLTRVNPGWRTLLIVPLRRDDAVLGYISSYRLEVRPFSDKEISLFESFAAQAVIAMENARLITEQREALEQQTATAEVLQVINASPGNLAPVFDAMLEKAMRLCDTAYGIFATYDGDAFLNVAWRGVPPALVQREEFLGAPIRPRLGALLYPLMHGEDVVHVADIKDDEFYRSGNRQRRALVDVGGARTVLEVALRKDNTLLGAINVFRQEVHPFTDKQIALLQTFAAQAVIAIENARLITEQQDALEQQTATAEVLQVINASPGNLTPVFEAILEKAHSLCDVAVGSLSIYLNGFVHTAATRGFSEEYQALLRPPYPAIGSHQALMRGGPSRQTPDFRALPVSPEMASSRYHLERMNLRTGLWVPLRKDGTALGCISSYRDKVQPFSEKEIALLENFAAQAVIAMENARLLTEQQEALEQQTATADVLRVINASPGDLTPVFDAILDKAHSLCGATVGNLAIYKDGSFHAVATHGFPEQVASLMLHPSAPNAYTRALIRGERFHQIEDIRAIEISPHYLILRALVEYTDVRTVLFVPLRKDGALLGFISVNRPEVRPFSEKEIALLENFAAQAVIAMENARLLNEQREALEQQTATAEVLGVINASPGNLVPVFDAILEKAMRLCEAGFGSLYTYDGDGFQSAAQRGVSAAYAAYRERRPPELVGEVGLDEVIRTRRAVQVTDMMAERPYLDGNPDFRAMVDLGGMRTAMVVPLCKDETALGVISVFRQEVRPFSDKQIALLENFAAQAVIAMENARLLNELRARTDELAQRQAELRITFENMGDGVAMFDETQYLAAWNRKFQDILDLPDALLGQHRTYEEHLLFLAGRGDFGPGIDTVEQINELVASTGQPYGYERTRPDGRVIEIRRNPVPDGGFVLIYSDITERKRSEEEIRAARDAAETALRELKIAQANLIQAEKMASLGQLTAGIAHEIKNPLNFVNNFAELSVDLLGELKDAIAPAEPALTEKQRAEVEDVSAMLTSNLEKITEHGRRADSIVKAMLEHSRGSSGERRMVDLNALIDEALNLAYHGARAQDQSFNITLERDFGAGIAPIEVNPQDITRVFLNLFANGFYATTKRARAGEEAGFMPTLKVTTGDAGDAVEIRVRDNGTGIPADIRDKLFQPFFTTKPTGEGTGLGLSITYDIVTQQHGGSIAVDSKVGEYSEFTIRLPRYRA